MPGPTIDRAYGWPNMGVAGACILLTTDATSRKGREIDLRTIVDEAVGDPDSPLKQIVVVPRRGAAPVLQRGRDHAWGAFISAFVVLRAGHQPSDELRRALLATARREPGPVAVIGEVNFVRLLPKSRSGKSMRRAFKAVTLGRDPGDISTIEDAGSVEEARAAWQQLRAETTAKVGRVGSSIR